MDLNVDKKPRVYWRANTLFWGALIFSLLMFGLLYKLTIADDFQRLPLNTVTFHTVKRGSYTDNLVTRAVAIPNESVIVSSERGGRVIEVFKSSSEFVNKGEVIARLSNYDFVLQVTSRIADATEQINNLRNMRMLMERDSRDTRIELEKAGYHLLKIKKEIQRNKKLYENFIIEKAKYENLLDEQAHWEKNHSILSEHEKQQRSILPYQYHEIDESIKRLGELVNLIRGGLEQLTIVSPIDGTLTAMDIDIGQQIKPGDKVTVVDNLHSYYFEAAFSEYYLDKIKPHVNVIAEAGGVAIPLAIESVSSVVDNGKFKARLRMIEPQQIALKRGQSIELRVSLETSHDALLAPSEAIFFQNGQALVYVYDEQTRRAVKTP